jgi:hypothetical protein
MSYKVKDMWKFIKSVTPYNRFNLGDIVFIDDDKSIEIVTGFNEDGDVITNFKGIEPKTVGVVIGYSENGDVITDLGFVGATKYATIYEIEKYRNNLIPHMSGASYVKIYNTENYTTEYRVVNKETAFEEFISICENKNIPIIEHNNYIAGGRDYGFLIVLFIN